MRAIVSVCADWGIGYQGKLLVPNSVDMQRFARLTCSGKSPAQAGEGEMLGCVVMGRKTAESFPGGKSLKARRNLVLTRDEAWSKAGFEPVHSPEELAEALASENPEQVWLIGGEAIYRLLLKSCSEVLVTFHDCVRPADAYFPNLDEDPLWELVSEEFGGTTPEGVDFSYRSYIQV